MDSEVWVFKEDGPPKFIDNYLEARLKGSKAFREDSRDKLKKMLAGRTYHICN